MYVGAAGLTLAAALLLPERGPGPGGWTASAWLTLLYLGLLPTGIGFWLWNRCLQELHATSVASFSYLQTLFALLIAWAALGESMSIVKIMAGVVIIAGVVIANVERRPFIFDGERPVRGEYPISPSN